ncbi:phage tail tape measure C-terminal domain-containing protein (plasmid) [Dechloromonas sp. ARDL1]|uniref:phage tail tape measure C-terminal domain-containing protein n=1 Tax=Dechloromonas sp. ARDL1 TaxID=3322121 RepID=UPI003DA77515
MAERNLSIRLSVVDGGKVKAELSEIGEKGERSLKKIEAASTPASSGLKLLSSAANDAKFQLQAATDRLGMLGAVLGKLGPAGLIAGASIAALGVGITALVMPVARVGDEFFKLSQKTGVSVEALTALDYAAKLSDVSTEGLTKGLQRLSVALFDSRFEGAEGSKALQALGVAAIDVHGQIRPTEQVLLDLAEKFADMPDGADKAALAIKLFGREGLSLIPFLNQGRDGITALMEEAQRLGLVMSEDVARASEVFNDNLTRLSALFEGVQRQIGAAVIPVLADFTEQVILAQTETGSFSNELQRITANREATLTFLESIASGLALIAESAVLLKRVIAQPFDSLSVVGKDIETWFKTELLTFYKNYGFDAQAIDAEIAKLQGARDEYVRAANDRLFNINQNPGYADRVARFFDEQRRTVRVMGQRFVLDTEAQAREVQAIYDRFLPTVPRPPRPPANLDLGAFARPAAAAKPDEGEAFLNQLRTRLLRTQEGEAAELRARALQIEAKGYQGVAAQAERYIQVLEAIERQKESDKAFEAYEKEEAASRKITEGLIGGSRQRIEALQLQREMLDLSADERAVLQARTELEKSATAARKEASQLQDADLRAQTIEAINDALARQLPIVENLIRANAEYQRSTEFGAKAALRTYIEDATNAAKQAERAVTGAFKSMEDALTQFVMTGKLDFNSLANSIISDLIRIQIQRAITLPLANFAMSLFAPAASAALPLGSGDLMGVNANIAHSGGLLGSDGLPSRIVDPGLFAGARRFHTGGLVSGEVPIIARQGEAVFTPGQLRALGGAVATKPQVNVEVNVINRASGVETRVEQQQQPDGSTRLDVIVEQMEARMARSISQGSGLAPTLERRYGLNPAAGAMR